MQNLRMYVLQTEKELKMLNYSNLSDVEFENLCQDVMSSKLKMQLHKFAPGRDGGIDLRNDEGDIIVQVKHYMNSPVDQLISSLKKELPKVDTFNPKKYFVCCSKMLTPQKIDEIYNIFSKYMISTANIITLSEIDDFLAEGKNIEILKKHYKLWLGSTNILEEIFTKDIGIDSDILFSDIKSEIQYFVRTKAYDLALDCLSKTRSLLIIGDPGVGKTVTSKMLILYYLSEGYRLRYTTDGVNLSDLKKALTQNPEQKEIIFLDDCFGQAYFRMKETQGNELLYIIKHVNLHSNKIIILNSRITIYSEAKSKTPGLIKSFDNKDYKLFVLDMTNISDIDKAEILYNHLFFNKIDAKYFDSIKFNKRYVEIIKHPNYNPRIIEYISNRSIYEKISPNDYFSFIISNLNNPQQVWRDEYENRLDVIDRLLLTTIYSLTNTNIPIDLVKRCFDFRLQAINGIDYSLNHFELSLRRLAKAFIKIVDNRGEKMLSMVNPSINDFLDSYLCENIPERNNIIKHSCSVRQLKKILPPEQYVVKLQKIFVSHEILAYCFENESQRIGFITYFVANHNIKDSNYLSMVQAYLSDVRSVDLYDKSRIQPINILQNLLKEDLVAFYQIGILLKDELFLMEFLDKFQFDDLVDILILINGYFTGEERKHFTELVKEIILDKVEWYCTDVPAENYDIDVNEIVNSCQRDEYIHDDEIEEEIEIQVSELVINDVRDYLDKLPPDMIIDKKLEDIDITINGAKALVDEYFTDFDYDPEMYYDRDFVETNEIDLIFDRPINN